MARTSKSTKAKGRNGEGDSLTVFFDQSDPAERRALEAARLLAAKHGRRKQVIVTLLESIYAYYEQTGDLLSATEIANALREGALPTFRPAPTAAPARPEATAPQPSIERVQAKKARKTSKASESLITLTQKKHVSAKSITANFLSGISGWID